MADMGVKDLTPYRSQALVVPEQSLKKINDGVLLKNGCKPSIPHVCNTPSWFYCWRNNIHNGAVWICKCGLGWKREDRWGYLTMEQRNAYLSEQGYPALNPWKEED
jgi:hypothetical protein